MISDTGDTTEPIISYSFLLIMCLYMSVIYCARILCNMRGYENSVMEMLSSYCKQVNNNIYNYISVKRPNLLDCEKANKEQTVATKVDHCVVG